MAKLIPTAMQYYRPETPAELEPLLGSNDPAALFIGGGTGMAFSRPAAERIVDLSRMPWKGCRRLADGSLEIGAVTTIGELERLPDATAFCGGILRQATDKLASTPLRNLITVGGNVAAGFAWSDLPVVFLALDARYRAFPGNGDGLHPLAFEEGKPLRRLTR